MLKLISGSVYRRILGSFMLITAMIAVISIIGFVQLGRVQETTSAAIPTSATLPLIQEYTVVLSHLDAETERFLVIGGINIQDQILINLETLREIESEINAIAPTEIQAQVDSLDTLTNDLDDSIAILLGAEDASSGERNQQILNTFDAIENTSLGLQTLSETITTQLQTTMTSQQNILLSVLSQQLILTVIMVVGALVGSVVLARAIVNPLTHIAETTAQIAQGQYSQRVTVESTDEIGQLGNSFNNMAVQLEELIGGLEERVMEGVRDVTLASEVSRQIATELDSATLFDTVSELMTVGFDLYHVSIFVYDEELKQLTLAGGTGAIGDMMMAQGKLFAMDDLGVVPEAARTRVHKLSNDAINDAVFSPNPLLPETQAELAIPMIYNEELRGILDIQSKKANRFSDNDVRIMTTVAEQIAIALQNAHLFEEAQSALEEAERANKVKSAFLAGMSHELRTPLNAILNFSQFVSTGMMGAVNEEQIDMMNKITGSGKHLLNLINDVLDISKIEAGSLRLFVEDDIDLTQEVELVVDTGRVLLEDKLVELKLNILPDTKLSGDKRRIRQIMLNLVSNACKFTEEGEIIVSLYRQGEEVHLSIKDTGPGIAPGDYEMVFESFKQTNEGLRQGSGTGLGLAISRKLAEAHGGRIWLESQVGLGTTFYVALPIHSRVPEPEETMKEMS